MKGFLYTIILFVFLIDARFSKDLPSFITKCKKRYPEVNNCLLQRFDEIRPRLKQGIPELKIPPLEPLHLPKFEMHTGNGTSLDFHAKFEDLVIDYVTDFQVPFLDFDVYNNKIDFVLYFPKLRVRSSYILNGKILTFQLHSNGLADTNLTNIREEHHIKPKIITRNGKHYQDGSNDNTTMDLSLSGMQFSNIFKENEQLTTEVNKAINEDIHEIEEDIKPMIEKTILDFGRAVLQGVFDDFSLEELFD